MTSINERLQESGTKIPFIAGPEMAEILSKIPGGQNGEELTFWWIALNELKELAFDEGRRSVTIGQDVGAIVDNVSEQITRQEAEGGMMADHLKVRLAARLAIEQLIEIQQGEL